MGQCHIKYSLLKMLILEEFVLSKYEDNLFINSQVIANKFQELKKLAIEYKEGKDKEINKLNEELDSFKKTVEESNNLYESMLDKTTESLEKILLNTESNSKVQ